MNLDAWTLEKAAFACFSNKLEDSYKRLLFIHIDKALRGGCDRTTANKCFGVVQKQMAVNRVDFDAAIRAMETPFKRIRINNYFRRRDANTSRESRVNVTELNFLGESPEWNAWIQATIEKYPELSIWVNG